MLVVTIVVLSFFHVHVFIKFAVTIIFIILFGKQIYDCSRGKLFLYGLIMVLVELCSEVIVIQLWNRYNQPIYTTNLMYEDFELSVVIMVMTIYFITMFLLGKIIKRNNDRVKLREIYPMLISGIPFLIILLGIHVSMPKIHEASIRYWFLISSVGIFVAFVFNVIYIQNYLEMIDKNKESAYELEKLKMKSEYYLQKYQSEEKIKEIYHDLKNYFILSDDKNINQELRKKLSLYERFYETGNDFLNIILAEKLNRAYECGVKMECHIDFSEGNFIEALDITTIFGNLLDNALEATEKIEDSEKYIFIDAMVKRKFLILVIKNNMSSFKNEKLETDKWNQSFHGYGLKNVRKAVKKYNGEIKINMEGREFKVSVVLPLPQK